MHLLFSFCPNSHKFANCHCFGQCVTFLWCPLKIAMYPSCSDVISIWADLKILFFFLIINKLKNVHSNQNTAKIEIRTITPIGIGSGQLLCQLLRASQKCTCETILLISTRRLRRGGLTPACGFAHARNGRACGQIEPISATVLPKRCTKKLRQIGQRKNEKTPPPLHPDL